MSKKVYICDTSNNHFTVQAIGNNAINQSFGTQAADALGYRWDNSRRPTGVQLTKLSTTSRTSTRESGTKYILKPSKNHKSCHFINLKLKISNATWPQETDEFIQTFGSKVKFIFSINVNYQNGGGYDILPLKVAISPLDLPLTSTFIIPITETFSNFNHKTLAPFHSLSIDRDDKPEVDYLDNTLTSTDKNLVSQFAATLHPYELTCDEIYSSETTTLKNIGIINDPRKGKLFLTFLKVKELANAHSAYPYRGITDREDITIPIYNEPDSKLYYRSTETVYEVFEYHKGTYSESGIPEYKNGYASYLNAVRDLNSSSADEARIYFESRETSESTITPSSLSFKKIEQLSWLDGCQLYFTFYRGGGNTIKESGWIPLSTCIRKGVDVPDNIHNFSVQMIVRDLCSLSTTDKPVSEIEYANLFIGGFYPYNPLQIEMEFGYATEDPSIYTGTSKAGVYYGTQKARRMLTPEGDDVKYIVIDAETT